MKDWAESDRVLLSEFLRSETGQRLQSALKDGIIELLTRATTIEEQALIAREAIGRKDLLMTIIANSKETPSDQTPSEFVDTTAGLV